MANAVKVNVSDDGPRNVVAKVTVVADTSDVSATTILDPATLLATNPPTSQLAIQEIQYSVQDGWIVVLYWDATTAKRIVNLTGRGIFPVGPNYGGIQNNAGVGKTGIIKLATSGYTSGTMYATLVLHCIKQSGAEQGGENLPLLTELGDDILTESGQPLLVE
jgi:hypothetical protein